MAGIAQVVRGLPKFDDPNLLIGVEGASDAGVYRLRDDSPVLTKPLGTGFVSTAYKAGRCPDATLAVAIESMIQLNVIGRDAAREAERREEWLILRIGE